MDDIGRPDPVPSLLERGRAAIEFVGVGRLLTVAASVAAVAAGGWWLLHAPPTPIEQQLPLATATTTVAGAGPTTPTAATVASVPTAIVVQAAGAVVHPGVYTLPAGSRIQDLISAAGGAVPGADPHALPLATVLVDGQRVEVPMEGEPVVDPVGVGAASAGGMAGPVDINRATVAELDGLPGVGPSTAAAIVEHRTANGPFASVDGLLDVRGIGPAKLEALRAAVTV